MASCNTGKISIKRRIIMFSSVGLGIAAATYLVFTTTNNPALAAAIPALLSFAVCPAMYAAVGGMMWLSSRFSRNKKKDNNSISIDTTKEQESCCNGISDLNKNERPQQRGIEILENKHEKDSTSILLQKHQVKFEN
jgi:hypothetical protein